MVFFLQAETPYKKNPKLLSQFQFAENMQIPLALVIGESEIAAGTVKLRIMATREEREVPRSNMHIEIAEDLKKLEL